MAEKDELCRHSSACSAGSQTTERSFLSSTSTPDPNAPSNYGAKYTGGDNTHQTATPSTSTDSTVFQGTTPQEPIGRYKRSKSVVDTLTRTNSLLSSGDEEEHLSSIRRARARSFDQRPRRPRREQRSMSVVVGLNGQVWTREGTDRPEENQHANNVAMHEEVVETMAQNYYPEGGWGWGICACATWIHILLVGGHLGGVGTLGFITMEIFEGVSTFASEYFYPPLASQSQDGRAQLPPRDLTESRRLQRRLLIYDIVEMERKSYDNIFMLLQRQQQQQ
ncbi:uncharacterized protein LOC111270696 [Varroa jacobsoni]|nr:uncharacterized protein LOC111270696 [Varroa jacobsoni]